MNQDRCPCGGVAELLTQPRKFTLGHWSITIDATFMKCSQCGEEWYSAALMQATQEKAASLVRQKYGLLDPERIRSLRRRYGWTQADLEHVLGVGAKTVVRWEKGSVVPGSATNTLMEILESNPGEAERLSTKHGANFEYNATPPLWSWSGGDTFYQGGCSSYVVKQTYPAESGASSWLIDLSPQSTWLSFRDAGEVYLPAKDPDESLQEVA